MSVISDNNAGGGYQITRFRTQDGDEPFSQWLEKLKDQAAHIKILKRMNRIKFGNLGDWGSVGGGVYELRIHWGPGIRVYFGFAHPGHIVLLLGGAKRTQVRDIHEAKVLWLDFKRRF